MLFEQRRKVPLRTHRDIFNDYKNSYECFIQISNKVWIEPYNYLVIDRPKIKNTNGKLRINWDRKSL